LRQCILKSLSLVVRKGDVRELEAGLIFSEGLADGIAEEGFALALLGALEIDGRDSWKNVEGRQDS